MRRGRGQIVAAACAADVIILATSRGYLLRYQWDEYGNEKGARVPAGATKHTSTQLAHRAVPACTRMPSGSAPATTLLPSRAAAAPSHSLRAASASYPCFYPNTNTVIETELTRQADSRVRCVFLDPSGTHSIVCLRTASSTEVQYVHSSWTKPRVLGKLKGLQLSAVGWQKQAGGAAGAEDGRPGSSGSSRSSRPAAAAAPEGGSDDALLQFVTG